MKYDLKENPFFLISLGAIPAAILRWQIKEIFIVNIIGCFLIGFINSLNCSQKNKLIFAFGFCGSLTTFSGWIFDLFELIKNGYYGEFLVNSLLMVLIGFVAISLGNVIAKKMIN
tara:strand:+ start:181 stop:525 length:345 start_codon:yes stop_codon:yes gene_type:complete